jgi:serpin B
VIRLRKTQSVGLALALAVGLAASGPNVPPATAGLVKGCPMVTAFEDALFRKSLGRQTAVNFVQSPASVSAALGSLLLATKGEARAAILDSVLQTGEDPACLSLADLKGDDGVAIKVATGLWVSPELKIEPGFEAKFAEATGASLARAKFADAAAVETINAWADKATDGAIKTLLERPNPAMTMLLASAIAFKGKWQTAFQPSQTSMQPFRIAGGKPVDVMTMTGQFDVEYMQNAQVQAINLPYAGGRYALQLIVPAKGRPVGHIATALKAGSIDALVGRLAFRKKPVAVSLPRFKATSAIDLGATLSGMGLAKALGTNPDFGAMTADKIGDVSVLHQASIEVEETGTTAAAVTTVTGVRSLAVGPRTTFVADQPFLASIVDRQTKRRLFTAYIGNPAS